MHVSVESDSVADWMRIRAIALLLLVAGLAIVLGKTLLRLSSQTSARESAERNSRETAATLRALNHASTLGTFVTDADGGLRRANIALERMTGLSAATLTESGWQSALHPDDRERVSAAWKAAVSNTAPFASEHRFLHRNGNLVWVSMKSARIEDGGKLVGLVGSAEDVSERRSAEEALRRSEERLHLVLEGSQLVLFDWHLPSGEILLSPQSSALTGTQSEDGAITARRFAEWLRPDDREIVREALIGAFKGKTPGVQTEFHVRGSGGRWRRVRANGRVTERDAVGRAVQLTGTLSTTA